MANEKISAMAAATTPLAGTELATLVQGGVNTQVSVTNLTAGRATAMGSGSSVVSTTGSSTFSILAADDNEAIFDLGTPVDAAGVRITLFQGDGYGEFVIETRQTGSTFALRTGNQAIAILLEEVSTGVTTTKITGSLRAPSTITAAATTGDQIINKMSGSVNFAAAATSLTVTNSLVTTNSIIICTVGTNDTTLKSVSAVAGAGSFVLNASAAASGETRVNFLVINKGD